MKRIRVLLATLLAAAGLGAADIAADHTPLQRAAMRQQADAVDALLEQGAAVGAENHRGRTALHYAVLPGQEGTDYSLRMVRALLAHGADPNHVDVTNRTPLDLAIERGTHAVVRVLLANGGNPNRINRNGYSALTVSMIHGRMDVADSLEEYGARHGVSPRETALLPQLPKLMELSKGLRDAYELNGKNPEAYPAVVRRVLSRVYPDMHPKAVERLVKQTDNLVAGRKAQCALCPAERPRLTGGAK